MVAFFTIDCLSLQTVFIRTLVSVVLTVSYLAEPAFSQTSMESSSSQIPPEENGLDVFLEELNTSMGKIDGNGVDIAPDREMNGGTPASTSEVNREEEEGSFGNTRTNSSVGRAMSMDTNSRSGTPAKEVSISFSKNKYKMYVGLDLPEGDILRFKNLNISQCIKICNKEKDCSAVTYDRWNRYCFTKNVSRSAGRLFIQAKSDTYILESETGNISASSSTIEIKRRRGKGFNGKPDYQVSNVSYEQCKRVCRKDRKCVAFNHIGSQQTCEFFFKPTEYFSKSGYQIGVKQQIQ